MHLLKKKTSLLNVHINNSQKCLTLDHSFRKIKNVTNIYLHTFIIIYINLIYFTQSTSLLQKKELKINVINKKFKIVVFKD